MSSYSEGSIHQLADSLEAGGWTGGHITRFKQSPKHIEDVRLVLDGEAEIVRVTTTKLVPRSITRLIKAGLVAGPTSGKRTMAKAKRVFTGYIDPDFVNWGCDVSGRAMPERLMDMHELVQNGDYRAIWAGLGAQSLERLCMEQEEIEEFCVKYQGELHPDYATFFLFKVGDEVKDDLSNLFVARVHCYERELEACVDRFRDGIVWDAGDRYRIVFPQL